MTSGSRHGSRDSGSNATSNSVTGSSSDSETESSGTSGSSGSSSESRSSASSAASSSRDVEESRKKQPTSRTSSSPERRPNRSSRRPSPRRRSLSRAEQNGKEERSREQVEAYDGTGIEVSDAGERRKKEAAKRERDRSASPKPTRIHVGHLTRNINRDHLVEIFSVYGPLKTVHLPLTGLGINRGFAYLEYEKNDDLLKAQKFMHGAQVDGQRITISFRFFPTKTEQKSSLASSFPLLRPQDNEPEPPMNGCIGLEFFRYGMLMIESALSAVMFESW
uniref:RRM domain-containing protein n=1 Tax=Trichuris muris TaxID=70415 RepID=A0A5S6QRA8_TRIMR